MLYLASNSPRRQHLLGLGGWEFQAVPANIDESSSAGEKPQDYVLRLAKTKLQASVPAMTQAGVIFGADTAVVDNSDSVPSLIGKPSDMGEATRILHNLRGRTHQVYTGLVFLNNAGDQITEDFCITDVTMRQYSNKEIAAYVSSGDALDKAGAYAIQHAGFHPVQEIRGCFTNVMGLPLCHVSRNLEKLGIPPMESIPVACQEVTGYKCPVYKRILSWET